MFNYISVGGMLLYLSGYNRPEASLVANFYSQYTFSPKLSHNFVLKRLVCYLKQTKNRGLVLDPNSDACKVESYLDANFSGMYGHEKPTNTACVKSCTGFIIMFADFPVL